MWDLSLYQPPIYYVCEIHNQSKNTHPSQEVLLFLAHPPPTSKGVWTVWNHVCPFSWWKILVLPDNYRLPSSVALPFALPQPTPHKPAQAKSLWESCTITSETLTILGRGREDYNSSSSNFCRSSPAVQSSNVECYQALEVIVPKSQLEGWTRAIPTNIQLW